MRYALGRRPRHFNPAIPHMSALRMLKTALPPVPDTIDYDCKIPFLGMLANDRLGDCTAAACFHAEQVWTQCAAGQAVPIEDFDVIQFYSECSGYDPHTGANDNGAVEQTVLTNWMTTGIPLNGKRSRCLGIVEIDPRNLRDVRRAIYECGVVYIGFQVPSDITQRDGSTWDTFNGPIIGGHAIVMSGFDSLAIYGISWGGRYRLTERFWHNHVDECYAIIDPDWAQANGRTLLNMTLDQLKGQMETLRRAA